MAALPYMQLYVADYLADTMHLSAEEHGAYLLLIMNYWQTGKPINEKHISCITKIDKEKVTDVISTLQHFFNIDSTGLWHHKRIDEELEKVRQKSLKTSLAGKKSAKKRWGNNEKVTDVITDVTKVLQHNCNYTDTDTDTDTDKYIKKKRTVFIKPSIQEISDYIKEMNYLVSAISFHSFYESKGWKVGNVKMVSWKSAIVNWQNRNNENKPQKEERAYL